jgi:hypothetical protein
MRECEKYVFVTGHVFNDCNRIVVTSLKFTASLIQFSSELFSFAIYFSVPVDLHQAILHVKEMQVILLWSFL